MIIAHEVKGGDESGWYAECRQRRIPYVVYSVRRKTVRVEWKLLTAGISPLALGVTETEELRDVMRPFFPAGQYFHCGSWADNVIPREQWEAFQEAVFPVLERVVAVAVAGGVS